MTPGNHEDTDEFWMLASRFIMPGTIHESEI